MKTFNINEVISNARFIMINGFSQWKFVDQLLWSRKNDSLKLRETMLKCKWNYEYKKDVMIVINNIATNVIVSVFWWTRGTGWILFIVFGGQWVDFVFVSSLLYTIYILLVASSWIAFLSNIIRCQTSFLWVTIDYKVIVTLWAYLSF